MKNKKGFPFSSVIQFCIVGTVFFSFLVLSWLKWGSLIVDTFRDQWVAYNLTIGRTLYKDIFYHYGFLAPYSISFLYKVFGVNIIYSVLLGIFITGLSCYFLYRLSRLFLNRTFSTVLLLNFILVFSFGCYCYNCIFNFILPYSFSSTFLITFVLSSLYFYIKFIRKKHYKYLVFWALSMCFVFLSRIDFGFPTWLVFVMISGVCIPKERKMRVILYMFIPLLISILFYWLFLYLNDAFSYFRESIINMVTFCLGGGNKFDYIISGLDDISYHLKNIIKSFFSQLTIAFLFYLMSVVIHIFLKKTAIRLSSFLLYTILGTVAFAITFLFVGAISFFIQYRLMPLVLLGGILIYLFRLFFGKEKEKASSYLVLFVISLLFILRIVFRASPNGYGFFLLVPSLVCYYIFFKDICFSFFATIIRVTVNRNIKHYYLFFISTFFLLLSLLFARLDYKTYSMKKCYISTPRGNLYSFCEPYTQRFWETVYFLKKQTAKNAKVVVFPEGIGINFLSQRDNPLRYHTFLPPIIKVVTEDKIINSLNKYKIDYIIILSRATSEYGYPFFGIHYGKNIYQWILNNYKLIKVFGPYPFTSLEFGVAIFKRK